MVALGSALLASASLVAHGSHAAAAAQSSGSQGHDSQSLARSGAPATASPAAATFQDWPTYLHDAARSDASGETVLNTTNVPYLQQRLAVATGGIIATEPVVAAGIAYVGSWDGYEYAINLSDGSVMWKTFLGTVSDPVCVPPNMGITSTATVANGVVYVGGANDSNNQEQWYALNASNGSVIWSVPTGPGPTAGGYYNWSSPLLAVDPADGNQYAYIGISSVCDAPLVQGQLLKVSLTTHQVVASANMVPAGQVGGGIWTSPTYDASSNRIFVSTGTLNLYSESLSQAVVAVNATTMQVVDSWQLPFESAVSDSDWGTSPTLTTDGAGDQLLSVANKNGTLYTFNRNNLTAGPVWQSSLAYGGDCPTCGDGTISSGAFANNVLYYAAGSNSDASGGGHGGSITAFNAGTGAVLWRHETNSPILGSIVYDNGMLFYANGTYEEALSAGSGQSIWDYNMGSGAYAAPTVSNGMLLQGSVNKSLYVFAPPANLPPAPAADTNCPSGFTCQDLGGGSGRVAGSETVNSDGSVTVVGSGNWRANGDQMRYISKPATGDFQVVADDLTETPGPSCSNSPSSCYYQPQIGIVIRQSFQSGSPFYVALQDPTYPAENETVANVIMYYRDTWGGPIVELTQTYPMAFPRYLMVQRHYDTFQTLFSSDGTHWTLISGTIHTLVMPTTLDVGEGVASYAPNATSTGTYSNFAVAPPTATYAEQTEKHKCPTGWNCWDVGAGSPIGDETLSSGVWTVVGGGEGVNLVTDGFGNNRVADQFHFVSQPMPGDGTITGRLTALTNGSTTAQAALMMRSDLSEGSPFYGVVVTPNGNAVLQWRVHNSIQQRATISLGTLTFPMWFQINRYTDSTRTPVTTYYSLLSSPDGSTWSQVNGSTVAINMGNNPLAGMAGSAATPRATNSATWDNIAISNVSTAPPGVCPQPFSCQDIGTGFAPGGQELSNGTWTFNAGGSDIWDVYDLFHYVYEPMKGDGTLSVQVTSAGPVNYDAEWEKAGVMMRATTDPQSPYYGVFVTPQHGIVVQWRSAQAQTTSQVSFNGPSYPVYLMAARWTDPHPGGQTYFTGYYSTDNKTFNVIPGSTVALPLTGTILAGMAADSYNEKATFPVTFNSFALFDGTEDPPPGACPATFSGCADIGGPLPGGTQTLNGTTLNVTAGGGDIWSTSDQFHYAWENLAGNGTASAQVSAQQDTDPWAKAGVMMRSQSGPGGASDASAPYYAALVTPGNGVVVQYRNAEGAATSQVAISGAVPVYLQVSRYADSSGNEWFSAYTSSDGTTWSLVPASTVQLPLTGTISAGWAATSHSQGTAGADTFSNIAVTTNSTAPAGVCPTGWSCSDIGGATPGGTQSLNNNTWTVQGGGGDIWSTSDQFHYVYGTLPGDGVSEVRVASLQNTTNSWAKAGLMLRLTTDPGSPYYGAFITPGNGLVIQFRTAQGATTSNVQLSTLIAPVYLQITRSGTTFSFAYSTDGSTWTPVTNATMNIAALTGSLLDGMALTSHDTSTLATATFDNVTIP